ncbi:glycoside hydrolase superfamily [Aspergillus pseudoustus]|uniref:Probable beta-glucosidase G n=1 Tax=Aspergillus pseudoustus TaxID=1810923 RepID=A0ABR4IIV4_9EURO
MLFHRLLAVTAPVIGLLPVSSAQQENQEHFQPIDVFPSPFQKARDLAALMTLEEKAGVVTGGSGTCGGSLNPIPRLNFSGLCFQDSPVGVRETDFTTVFPAGISAAASFDKQLIYQRADYMGAEFRGKGINVALSPVAGPMGRHPHGGRNWEGFGIDPYLALSSNIDDRALHELYLWPFAQAVRAGISWIMFTIVLNQTYACENSKALNGILKDELGFQGAVISDWGSTRSGLVSIEAGLDVTMPGGADTPFGSALVELVQNRSLPESRLNDMVQRVLTPYFFFKQDVNYPPLDASINELKSSPAITVELEGFNIGGEKNRDVRAASAVLLKNAGGALPLKNPKNIAVFGNDAADLTKGQSEAGFLTDSVGPEFGTLGQGGGSASARYTYFVSPLEAIKSRAQRSGALVQYILDNEVAAESINTIYPIPEVCLVFLKSFATENFDRTSLDVDWNGTAVVNTVSARCANTIVITHSAGINLMPWDDNQNVTAIIAAHLPGQEAGNSIVDILYGDVNPSGRLPYTIAFSESDYNTPIADFTEGLFVDYRHFDRANITPRYEFGFRLSYTTFELAGSSVHFLANASRGGIISPLPAPQQASSPGGNPSLYDALLKIRTTVTNSGNHGGATVAQLYAEFPESAPAETTPLKVLRGFEKTAVLKPGESETVEFTLTRRDLSYWDVEVQDWRILEGEFVFHLGFSSRDTRDVTTVTLV